MSKAKKKHVSMKKKSSWRKHTDIQDVEDFLEETRLHERIGTNVEIPDEELFKEDTIPAVSLRQAKKLRAKEPSKCFMALENNSKVAPLLKNNKCKDPEAKKHPLVRAKQQRDKEMGIIRPRLMQSLSDRITASKKIIKSRVKKIDFNRDLWAEDDSESKTNEEVPMQSEWMNEKLKQYHLKNLGEDEVKVPLITHEKRSQLKAIEVEAGTSYNPHDEDLKNLIDNVVKKEEVVIKKEQKLNRALKQLYQKVAKSEIKRRRREEMRQGFPINSNDEDSAGDESDTEYKTLNPPVRNKKKDLKQRRKQKENKLRQAQRAMEKQELSKLRDLGALKMFKKQIKKKEDSLAEKTKIRKQRNEQKKFEPRRLGRRRFEEQELKIEDSLDTLGNLRKIKPAGSILVDRFKSMQKRNLLAPNVKRMPRKRRLTTVKKKSHKEELEQPANKLRMKLKK